MWCTSFLVHQHSINIKWNFGRQNCVRCVVFNSMYDTWFRTTTIPPYFRVNTLRQTTFSNAFSWMKTFELQIKYHWDISHDDVMRNNFRVTGPLCGEFTGDRWIPLTKASDVELWCFPWSAPEQTFELTIETPVIWDAIPLMMTSL